jgi:hypothetical protein
VKVVGDLDAVPGGATATVEVSGQSIPAQVSAGPPAVIFAPLDGSSFTTPGTYDVTIKVNGVECGRSKLTVNPAPPKPVSAVPAPAAPLQGTCGGSLALDPPSVDDAPNQTIRATVGGLDANAPGTLFENGAKVGSFTTDANGAASTSFTHLQGRGTGSVPVQAATASKCAQINLVVRGLDF